MREPGTHREWLAAGASVPHFEMSQPAALRPTDTSWGARAGRRRLRPSRSSAPTSSTAGKLARVQPPPPGPPWDLPVAEAPLAFVDLEMTGLDAARDRVVEVCIERVVGGRARGARSARWSTPGERVGGAAHVHGLDAAALAGAPRFESIASDVVAALDGRDPRRARRGLGRAVPRRRAARAPAAPCEVEHWLDTLVAGPARLRLPLVLARRALPRARHRPRAGPPRRERRAARCARSSTAASTVLAPVSARDLWEVRVGERRARQAIVDACEAAVKHGVAGRR